MTLLFPARRQVFGCCLVVKTFLRPHNIQLVENTGSAVTYIYIYIILNGQWSKFVKIFFLRCDRLLDGVQCAYYFITTTQLNTGSAVTYVFYSMVFVKIFFLRGDRLLDAVYEYLIKRQHFLFNNSAGGRGIMHIQIEHKYTLQGS